MKLFALVLLFSTLVFGQTENLNVSSFLVEKLENESRVDAFVFLKDQVDVSEAAKIIDRTQRIQYVYDKLRTSALTSQAEVIQQIQTEGLEYQSFHIINAVLVKQANLEQLERLSQLSSVARIDADQKSALRLPNTENNEPAPINPIDIPANIKQINADKVWLNLNVKGAGIVVAGQDTGYAWQHPAIKNQYRGYSSLNVLHDYNWHDAIRKPVSTRAVLNKCGYNSAEPCDDGNHGTHTMGTMIGLDYGTEKNRIGVAPEAKWIGCRNMDDGYGRASTYLECFEYFLAPYPRGGNPKLDGSAAHSPHIINNSWGCPKSEGCTGNEFAQVIDNLHAAGILVVASAGNDGSSCGTLNTAPGFYSGKLFSVASSDVRSGNISSFSSRGPSSWNGGVGPNITAPGGGVRSSVPNSSGFGYTLMSGTSMAGPHVVGAVALLWSAKPALIGNIQGTLDIIQKTAKAKTTSQNCGNYPGTQIPNAVYGYGIIDIEKAILEAN